MPVAESDSQRPRQVALVSIALFLGVIGGILILTQISNSNTGADFGFSAGSRFQAGNAEVLATTIQTDGPLSFSDVAGGSRDIILQHTGQDAQQGWSAFVARPPAVGRHCVATWQADTQEFILMSQDEQVNESCPAESYPADGEGLDQLPVTIEAGTVVVDINAAERSSSTTVS